LFLPPPGSDFFPFFRHRSVTHVPFQIPLFYTPSLLSLETAQEPVFRTFQLFFVFSFDVFPESSGSFFLTKPFFRFPEDASPSFRPPSTPRFGSGEGCLFSFFFAISQPHFGRPHLLNYPVPPYSLAPPSQAFSFDLPPSFRNRAFPPTTYSLFSPPFPFLKLHRFIFFPFLPSQ